MAIFTLLPLPPAPMDDDFLTGLWVVVNAPLLLFAKSYSASSD